MNELIALIVALLIIVIVYFFSKNEEIQYRKNLADLKQLTSREFEFFCSTYLASIGYKRIKVTPPTRDGGKDIVAYKQGNKYVVECKKYDKTVGVKVIRGLYAVAHTSNAIAFANHHGIIIITNDVLVNFYRSIGG